MIKFSSFTKGLLTNFGYFLYSGFLTNLILFEIDV